MSDMKERLSTLWIFVLFNMLFADVIGFMNPGDLEKVMSGDVGVPLNQGLLLIFSILQEIPIAMVVLSRVLSYRLNRPANIVSGIITIVYVVGGGDAYLSYIFFATVEIVCIVAIVWYAWRWSEPAEQP